MNWTPKAIRELRLRLGWSAAEFGRRMGCSVDLVHRWENGTMELDPEAANQMHHLFAQVEHAAQRISQLPLAEMVMDREQLSQVTHDVVQRFEPKL